MKNIFLVRRFQNLVDLENWLNTLPKASGIAAFSETSEWYTLIVWIPEIAYKMWVGK